MYIYAQKTNNQLCIESVSSFYSRLNLDQKAVFQTLRNQKKPPEGGSLYNIILLNSAIYTVKTCSLFMTASFSALRVMK